MAYKIIAVVFLINALLLFNQCISFKNHLNRKSIASEQLKLCFTFPKAKL